MNTKPLLLKLSLSFLFVVTAQMTAINAQADILALAPHAKVLTRANMPKPGDSMNKVSKKFGAARHVSVSKGPVTRKNPKITRWDYTGFSVYFENSHVIHSVIHR